MSAVIGGILGLLSGAIGGLDSFAELGPGGLGMFLLSTVGGAILGLFMSGLSALIVNAVLRRTDGLAIEVEEPPAEAPATDVTTSA